MKVVEKRMTRKWKKGDIVFACCMLVLPLVCFAIGYVWVNSQMVIMAFQKYDGAGKYSFVGFANFSKFFQDVFNDEGLGYSLKNSLINYVVHLLWMPGSLVVSYSLYKKVLGSKIYRIVLFLPSMITGMIWVMIYSYIVQYGISPLLGYETFRLLDDPNTQFVTVLIYTLWVGFAGNLILYSGAMGRIPTEVVESAKLDGVGIFGELWHITIPLIFPTISVFLVTGVIGFFSADMGLYTFFGETADLKTQTLGYRFFIMAFQQDYALYPYASAAGLVFTLIAAPITLLVKYLLEKFGPNAEY